MKYILELPPDTLVTVTPERVVSVTGISVIPVVSDNVLPLPVTKTICINISIVSGKKIKDKQEYELGKLRTL